MNEITSPAHKTSANIIDDAPRAAPLWRRVVSQTRYEALTMARNGEQLLLLVILPVIALVALSQSSILDGTLPDSANRVDYAVAGVLALSVISNAFSGQGIQTGFDRRYGVLRQLSTTPLGRSGLIAGKFCAVLTVLVAQCAVIIMVGLAVGWKPPATAVAPAVIIMFLGAAAFTSLGLLVAGILRAEATLAVVNLLWVLLAAAGGTLAPTTVLPTWFAPIVSLLPSAALADGLRHVLVTHSVGGLWGPALILVLWTAAAWAVAARWFRWN